MAKKAKKPAEEFVGYRYWSPNIPMSAIRRYARQIAEKFQPDKIILFGSYAYGQPHEWSDVDILVVMPAYNQTSKAIRIINTLEAPFSLDLIVRTPKWLQRDWEDGDWFLREVLAKGKVLYEKTGGEVGKSAWPGTDAASGERLSMRRLTARWVRRAEDELRCAQLFVREPPSLPHHVCFHCQQSAQEYLKALLQQRDLVPRRTDDLLDLLGFLLPHDEGLRRLRRGLNSLARYTPEILYPGGRASNRQAQAALRHAEEVRREIRTRLGLSP